MELKAAARTWPIYCLFFFALLTVVPQVSAIRCYICGPVSPIDVTRRNIPTSKSTTPHSLNDLVTGPCDQFDTDIANRVHFERECPAEYQGCATQIEGGRVSRTCETLSINSCGQLKDSEYCMCDTDLCNDKPIKIPEQSSPPEDEEIDSTYADDEDYFDGHGSGHKEITDHKSNATTEAPVNLHNLTTRMEIQRNIEISTSSTEASIENSTISFPEEGKRLTSGAANYRFIYHLVLLFITLQCYLNF